MNDNYFDVKIVKCPKDTYWYANKIGKVYTVYEVYDSSDSGMIYHLVDEQKWINKNDCMKEGMMLKVKYLELKDMPKDVKEEWEGMWDVPTFLSIYHNDELKVYHTDRMEPEDATFYRDLNWIGPAIEEAYKLGMKDGISIAVSATSR